MVSIEELTEKFGPVLEVAPWGSCIVVQGTEFDPDWEAELDDLGFQVFFETWDNHSMTVVPLKVPSNVVVKNMDKAKLWVKVEDDLLVSLWTVDPQLSVSEIASKFKAKFPLRSGSGVANRIQQLQQKEKRIEPRFIINKSGTSKEAKNSPEKDVCSENVPGTLDKRSTVVIGNISNEIDLDKISQKVSEGIAEHYRRRDPDVVKVEPADPDDNQAFTENYPHETSGIGKWSEGFQKPRIDDADVLVNLVKEVTVLREGYDSLNKAYVALQTKIECIWQDTEKTLGNFANEMPSNEDLAAVRKDLLVHEHSEKSGKVTIPLEDS